MFVGEYLDMDKGPYCKHQKGWFCKRYMLVSLTAAFIASLIAVGLLVGYLAPCRTPPLSTAGNGTSEDNGTTITQPYLMLPRSVIPEHYTIELQPFLIPGNFTFRGFVKILVKVMEDTDNITVHIDELNILHDTVKLTDDVDNDVPEITSMNTTDDVKQFFVLSLSGKLKAGHNYTLEMSFTGILNDDMSGFYRSSYENADGKTKWIATTQFEPIYARKAFPCFDEPALKAIFNVTLIHWRNMTSLSNMPIEESEPRGDDWVADHFQESLRMSTYLVAFVISDFASAGTPEFSVWSRPDHISSTEYVLEVGPKFLSFFEEFFHIPFQMPKMGNVAIPDFAAGAMENWGLITYRETSLLFDPRYSSTLDKIWIALTVAHEISHQWFGNLVTMEWWNDLWLNEGFANYAMYLAVGHLNPEWMMDQQFVFREVQRVMELDSMKSSHPISVQIYNPDEVNQMFDDISYSKGASVVRMMSFFLGSETFKKGLTSYLNAKKFANAVQDDLWEYLTAVQDKKDVIDVKKVMDTWTLQTGYPVVTVTRNYATGRAAVSQSRFSFDKDTSGNTTGWEIPFTYTTGSNPNWEPTTRLWLHKGNGRITNLPGQDIWIIGNIQQVGYYRVNYDVDNWNALTKQLMSRYDVIHTSNRAQVVDDSMQLARAGLLSYSIALNTTRYLTEEKEFVPWAAALNAVSFIDNILSRTRIYGKWTKYRTAQMEPLYKSLGWKEPKNETDLTKLLRADIFGSLCDFNYEPCVKSAKEIFQRHRNDSTTISPELQSMVYCTAVRHGGEDVWDFLWKQYLESQVASEKDNLMYGLTCATEPWLLLRYMDWTLEPQSGIRRQDGSTILMDTALNPYGRDLAFNFIQNKWNETMTIFGGYSAAISHIVKKATNTLNTPFELQQLKEFYKMNEKNLGTATRAFEQAIEKVEDNVKWMNTNFAEVELWINSV